MTLSKADEDELEATAIKSLSIGSGGSIGHVDCGGNRSVIIIVIIVSGDFMATLIVVVGRGVLMVKVVAFVVVVVVFAVMVVVVIVVVVAFVVVVVVSTVVVVEVVPLLLRASKPADAFLGDGGDAFAAEGLRLHLHDEGARSALLALAPGARVRPVFGVAFVGAHSHWFLAADGERTVLHADAHARAQLALQRSFCYGSPVALGFEGF